MSGASCTHDVLTEWSVFFIPSGQGGSTAWRWTALCRWFRRTTCTCTPHGDLSGCSGAHERRVSSDIQFNLGQTPTKYFRQGFPENQRKETLHKIGLKPAQFSDFSTYCSDRHSLTNFHFDQHPGCLQMCSGRKQVLLVHPRFSGYMRSFVEERRSWITSEIQAVTVPHWNITLNPGDCLFIPAGFWHQVKSLDSPTLGTVLRYK